MENTRKENFRGKWELLKSGLKAGLRSLMKAKVDVIRTKHEWFDYSDMTVKRYVFAVIVSFFLFWMGMGLSFFTENVLILAFALLPFYSWCFILSLCEIYSEIVEQTSLANFLTLLVFFAFAKSRQENCFI